MKQSKQVKEEEEYNAETQRGRTWDLEETNKSTMDDWCLLIRVMVPEPELGVHGGRSFEVGWGARQEERCWSP